MRPSRILSALLVTSAIVFAAATFAAIKPFDGLRTIVGETPNSTVTDRNNVPLSVSYLDKWNTTDYVPLHDIPQTLVADFIRSEDKNFYRHGGVDWRARAAALRQNVTSGRIVRGASTITEQVVRMIHPRPRNIWSKWIEGFEAASLERHADKNDILEFYLNQIPYGSNRRGIVQASRYYFDRDLSTLSRKEMIALVVLARAPSSYDLYKNPKAVEKSVIAFVKQSDLSQNEKDRLLASSFSLSKPSLPIDASHFIRYVRTNTPNETALHTTLDASLQARIQPILDKRVESLNNHHAFNGGLLIVDHTTGEIVTWAVAGAASGRSTHPTPGWAIDTVETPRQPGSAMKPLLYASALDKGWTPATLIDDSPLSEAIGTGLHNFRNYSRHFYGPLPLRETLGNSLNIPALKTIRFVGVGPYLTQLHEMGFTTLDRGSDIYEEGLALGNAEVTLHDLVQAYATLANRGVYRPLRFIKSDLQPIEKRIYSPEAASLIGNILSDPYARRLEFGVNSVLNLPVQTAVKTGTSNDYHDAWAVGYNDHYVVGVWVGNLDRTPMNGVTGSTGPALILRSAFAELNRYRDTKPLYLSPSLHQQEICIETKQGCFPRTEYFMAGTEPDKTSTLKTSAAGYHMVQPTDHLQVAYDPRIPSDKQRFRFEIDRLAQGEKIEWILNDRPIAVTDDRQYLWPLARGKYTLSAIIHSAGKTTPLSQVSFLVK